MTVSNISKTGENTAKICGEISNGTDTLKKASNVVLATLDIAMNILGFFPGLEGVKAGFGLLAGRLKDTKSIINVTSLLGRGYEWADSKVRKSILQTWQKTANRVALTVAQVFETVGFVDKLTVGFFSQPALSIGGTIPIFDIVKNSIYAISSVFGLWGATLDLQFADRSIKAANVKKKKWEQRSMELGGLDKFKFQKVVDKYNKKLEKENAKTEKDQAKIDKYKMYVNHLTTDHTPETHKDNVEAFQKNKASFLAEKYSEKLKTTGSPEELNGKIEVLEKDIADKKVNLKIADKAEKKGIRKEIKDATKQLTQLKADSVKSKKLETYVQAIKDEKVCQLVDHKIEVQKVRIHNSKNLHTKSWISIAAEVGKIFTITVGMLILGLSLVFPVLTTPAVKIVTSSCGLVASSFGLAKNLYRDVFFKSNMQTMPNFAATAA